jgi:hypothetical protein
MGPKKGKVEAEKGPKKVKVKGALHLASVAAARAKAERDLKKKANTLTEEDDELKEEEGYEESDGEEYSSSSTESQHFAKQDASETLQEKAKVLHREETYKGELQSKIDKLKKVDDLKMQELLEANQQYPSDNEVHNMILL